MPAVLRDLLGSRILNHTLIGKNTAVRPTKLCAQNALRTDVVNTEMAGDVTVVIVTTALAFTALLGFNDDGEILHCAP
jgi:hypothetical protein